LKKGGGGNEIHAPCACGSLSLNIILWGNNAIFYIWVIY
jgi:hypothetical protein